MAATTPRKRAPAKKAAPKSADVTNLDQFRSFRKRAQGKYSPSAAVIEDYVAGPEKGFDQPVVAKWPSDDMVKEIVVMNGLRSTSAALSSEDSLSALRADGAAILDVLQVLFGSDFRRILDAFNQYDDKWGLLLGLTEDVIEHFFGQSAGDVPGGFGAS